MNCPNCGASVPPSLICSSCKSDFNVPEDLSPDRRIVLSKLLESPAGGPSEIVPSDLLRSPDPAKFWSKSMDVIFRGGAFDRQPMYLALLDTHHNELDPRVVKWYKRYKIEPKVIEYGRQLEVPAIEYPVSTCEAEVQYAVVLLGDEPVFVASLFPYRRVVCLGDILRVNLSITLGAGV